MKCLYWLPYLGCEIGVTTHTCRCPINESHLKTASTCNHGNIAFKEMATFPMSGIDKDKKSSEIGHVFRYNACDNGIN